MGGVPESDRLGSADGESDRLKLLDPRRPVAEAGEVMPLQPVQDVVEVLGIRAVAAAIELQA